jgi:redox-sensitive bicupin YhaK (pirin superfamily)
MSWNPALEPGCPDDVGMDAIETLIVPRSRDLGGFEVRRALPAPKRQMVGPFIFFDQAGPAELLTGQGVDVRPHPHIGLGTVTYLFRGDFHHRDSTGADQIIRPGALNWMVAGRGVTHSERTSAAARESAPAVQGANHGWSVDAHRQRSVRPPRNASRSHPVLAAAASAIAHTRVSSGRNSQQSRKRLRGAYPA